MSSISIIVAMASNRTIGLNNTLPWRIPEDLRHFKALTMGHHMIMGRKTFESIGKPLPGRTTVVVTRDRNLKIDGCIMAYSLQDAIAACGTDDEIFVVGGAEIYVQALNMADTLYITEIQQEVAGDAWFPEFDRMEWQEASREKCHQEAPEPLEYHFATYHRNGRQVRSVTKPSQVKSSRNGQMIAPIFPASSQDANKGSRKRGCEQRINSP